METAAGVFDSTELHTASASEARAARKSWNAEMANTSLMDTEWFDTKMKIFKVRVAHYHPFLLEGMRFILLLRTA